MKSCHFACCAFAAANKNNAHRVPLVPRLQINPSLGRKTTRGKQRLQMNRLAGCAINSLGWASFSISVASALHVHNTWQKLSQYSVEDSTEMSCCLRTSSKALNVASRVSIATRVSSAVSRARSLHSCSGSILFSAIFALRHGAYAM